MFIRYSPCSSLNESLHNSIVSNDIFEITSKYRLDKLISDWVNQPMHCPMEIIEPDIPKAPIVPPKKKKKPKKKKTVIKPALIGYDTTILMRNVVNTPNDGTITAEVFNAEKVNPKMLFSMINCQSVLSTHARSDVFPVQQELLLSFQKPIVSLLYKKFKLITLH